MRNIKYIADRIVYGLGYNNYRQCLYKIIINWSEIVENGDIAASSKPTNISVKSNVVILYVNVRDGSIAMLLQHKNNIIIENIARYFGYKFVEKIKYIINFSEV